MADTQRDTATLQAIFAGGGSGIRAQDLRDFVLSVFGGYGALYVTGGVTAQTANIAAAKLGLWTGALPSFGVTPDLTAAPAGQRLVASLLTTTWLASFAISATGTAGRTFTVAIRKNGIVVAGGIAVQKVSSAGDIDQWVATTIVSLTTNDDLSVWVSSDVDASSLTVKEGSLLLKRLS